MNTSSGAAPIPDTPSVHNPTRQAQAARQGAGEAGAIDRAADPKSETAINNLIQCLKSHNIELHGCVDTLENVFDRIAGPLPREVPDEKVATDTKGLLAEVEGLLREQQLYITRLMGVAGRSCSLA